MTLHLTGDAARRLGAVTDALLSPLQWPTVDAWWRHVEPRLLELFPGATGMLSIAGPEGMGHYSESVDASQRRTMSEMTRVDEATGTLVHDDEPTERWIRYRRARRLPVWGQPMNEVHLRDLGTDISQCAWYHEGLVPARLRDFVGMTVDGPRGETYLCIGYGGKGRSRLGFDAELTLFELLFPAMRAAHYALAQFAERQTALAATLDLLPDALLVVGPDGRERHRSAALRALLAADPERERVAAEMLAAARAVVPAPRPGVVRGVASPLPTGGAAVGERRVATTGGRYAIRVAHGAEHLWGGPGVVLVSVEREVDALPAAPLVAANAAPLDDAALRARYGLTARESEVAVLLARRLTNAELAAALGVSGHTARHHTESVLRKLGIPTRRAAARALAAAVE